MKVAVYKLNWHDVVAGTSVVKYQAGVGYPLTDETRMHISQGHADEVDAVDDLPKAEAAAIKARKAADNALAKAAAAEEAVALAREAQRLAEEAAAEADAERVAAEAAEAERLAREENDKRIAAMNPEGNAFVAPPPPPPAPTRADLDTALGMLPGEQKDPDYVVGAMRSFFGDLFTEEDEKRVRDLVKAPAA